LFSGSASDFLSARRSRDAVTRTEFTTWCFVLMSCGMALLLIVPDASPAPLLALGVGVVGWSFGSLFWAMPTLVMELFGSKHFGANRGIVGLSPAIGGYLLSTKVAGRVYAAAAADGVECAAGGACFRNAWGINLAVRDRRRARVRGARAARQAQSRRGARSRGRDHRGAMRLCLSTYESVVERERAS
jgi:hypothetical protein